MNKQNDHELLSVLLDDEPYDGKAQKSYSRISDDHAFGETVCRYQIIRASLKGDRNVVRDIGFAASISEALREEPTVLAPRKARKRPLWIQPAFGGALAASVAAVGIIFGPELYTHENQGPKQFAPVAEVASVEVAPVTKQARHWKALTPEVESELNNYLEDHSAQASWSNTSGVMPYTNYVSYQGH